jgi:arabinose-5-phosphate isomerase
MNDPVCDNEAIETLAKAVIETELEAIQSLTQRIDADFLQAIQLLLNCTGRIIVTGIGKSGHIGNKIAATFASTGSPAHFVHAAEASHGDMGMLQSGDVVIAISYSGSSDEILKLIPGIKRLNLPLIAISGDASSALVKSADVALSISVAREACPLGLAPTASTTATLVLGDALAVSLLHARGFSADDFARSHPGGRLGRQLLIHVSDVMAGGADTPLVQADVTLAAALLEITDKGLGMVAVVDEHNKLKGIFTDGDLRRTIELTADFHTLTIADVMTHGGHTITADELAMAAVSKMQEHQISSLPVVDNEKVVGIVTMHGLLAAGVV